MIFRAPGVVRVVAALVVLAAGWRTDESARGLAWLAVAVTTGVIVTWLVFYQGRRRG